MKALIGSHHVDDTTRFRFKRGRNLSANNLPPTTAQSPFLAQIWSVLHYNDVYRGVRRVVLPISIVGRGAWANGKREMREYGREVEREQ